MAVIAKKISGIEDLGLPEKKPSPAAKPAVSGTKPEKKAGPLDAVRAAKAAEESGRQVRKSAKITMATLKALEPIVTAISYRPGDNADPVEVSRGTRELMNKGGEAADKVCRMMGADPDDAANAWIVGQLMSMATYNLGFQWRMNGGQEVNPSLFVEACGDIINGKVQVEGPEYEDLTATTRLKLSMMRAAVRVREEIEKAGVFFESAGISGHDVDGQVSRALGFILKVAERSSDTMEPEGTQEDRLAIAQSMIGHASRIWGGAYARAVDGFIDSMSAAIDNNEFEGWISESIKTGSILDIDAVEAAASRGASLLVDATESLLNTGKHETPTP